MSAPNNLVYYRTCVCVCVCVCVREREREYVSMYVYVSPKTGDNTEEENEGISELQSTDDPKMYKK